MSTRSVWAVDPLAGTVSLARIDSTRPVPAMGVVHAASVNSHTPRAQWERMRKAADQVVAKITADAADVQLVMLSKATWGAFPASAAGQTKDSTAQRRLQLQSYIEDGLHAAGVPVAEYPYITAARWAKGTLDPGMVGSHPMKELERWVFEDSGWGIEPVMETLEVPEKDGKEAHEITRRVIYRYPVLALCAIAAQAVGIDAGVPLNAARKELVRGAGNAMIQYPSGLKLAV
ncbi:hypothetical protein BST28_17525 [Mycolicibacter kumamotonensis]|uniref:DUF429 domain-containing protein n=1 Tax=Mycolicibacter kumamotonensis TaxID=354243 RepID=A0A1X0DYT5_9MYCO|nr:hypothetical protein [Mycolicibacter kumamotonensis]ORA77603.1 hypothetical protein BST28_17525 [Mycolicibacter kumamotonensis]